MSIFKFKKFNIQQTHAAMKIGTDGVLLGAWANATSPTNILDIGAGTGVIGLMLAQRFSSAKITAIEPDSDACIDAYYNFITSPFSSRLTLLKSQIQTYNSEIKFDLIVSNPPYFSNDLRSPTELRNSARHSITLDFHELLKSVHRLLHFQGSFNVVIPSMRAQELQSIALTHGLFLNQQVNIQGNNTANVKRCLQAYSFQETELNTNTLVIEKNRHDYTDDYINLTKEFYLNM
jgi:tRNA1Val (adenine37-N6)-methyltransferase